MIDPKGQAKFDQGAAAMADAFPPLWRRLYEKLLCEGFSEDQAMALLKTYIFAAFGGKGQI